MNWIRIFKTGQHTDSSGKTRTWTDADLDKIVTGYDPASREAPLVLGHPKDNHPAFGWVESVRKAGQYLEAKFKQVPESLQTAIQAGHYKYKSISLFPDGSLRHVGILGAAQPAVAGLGDVKFDDGEFSTINFEEGSSMTIEELQAKLAVEKEARKAAETKVSEFKDKAEGLEAKFQETETQLKKMQADFAAQQAKQEAKARDGMFNALVEAGKAKPEDKAQVLAFATALGGQEKEISFSATEGKKPLEAHFWAFMSNRPAANADLFGEYSAPVGDSQEFTGPDFPTELMDRI